MIELYDHQKRIIDDNPLWKGLFLGTGAAKTRTSLELAEGRVLVVCPKQQFLDKTFEKNAERFGINLDLTVMSKETFRRDWETLPRYDTVICDEFHHMIGITPNTRRVKGRTVPKTSQLFEGLYQYLKKHPPERLYLLSATPVSNPMHIFAIATLFGHTWDFFKFRDKYYYEVKLGFKSFWIPRKDKGLQERLVELTNKFGYTGELSDWFDVPDQVHEEIRVDLVDEQRMRIDHLHKTEADPMVVRAKQRTIENGCLYDLEIKKVENGVEKVEKVTYPIQNDKIRVINDILKKHKKALIFANYKGQIHQLYVFLKSKGHDVFVLTGETKNREEIFEKAETMDRVVVIAQATIAEGYEWKSCDCVVFASKSYRYVAYEQALGRVLRADAIKKNYYYHIIVRGGIDEECHKTILQKRDFQEKVMEYDRITDTD